MLFSERLWRWAWIILFVSFIIGFIGIAMDITTGSGFWPLIKVSLVVMTIASVIGTIGRIAEKHEEKDFVRRFVRRDSQG